MPEQVQLVLHNWPWSPGDDVRDVIELNRYDVPLLGVFEQRGSLFLFHCVVGEVEAEQVWLYAPVTPDELHALSHADEPDTVSELVAAIETGRPVTLAHADDRTGLLSSVSGVVLGARQPQDVAREALDTMALHLRHGADALSGMTLAS